MAKRTTINLKSAIQAKKGSLKYPVTRMVRDDPEAAIVISKLHKDPRRYPNYNEKGNREPAAPDVWRLRELSTETARNINDSQTAMQMLPDLELAAQILISIVLCPKDMMTVEVNYSASDDITSPDLKTKLLKIVKTYFDDKFKINSFLQRALRDILFETGSYPMAVIPENSVDYAINGYTKFSMESFKEIYDTKGSIRSLGLLGNPDSKATEPSTVVHSGLSLETFNFNTTGATQSKLIVNINNKNFDTGIEVIDNFNALKIPAIHAKARNIRESRAINPNNILNFSLESEIDKLKLNDRELTALLFKERSAKYQPIQSIKTDAELDRMMIGDPLIIHLPSESVIPVFIPGSPEKQIGYFVLLDTEGNPLDLSGDQNNYKELSSRMDSSSSFPSAMLSKVKSSMTGFDCNNIDHLNYAASVYGEMIEADLLSRLRNGKYVNGVAIAKKEEIYRIMLARAFSGKNTQLLWIPESILTYFGMRFNANGIGKSLLEDLKVISSLRAMITMANVMGLMKNSIARTGVRIKFDPDDPNPQKTLETAIHEILRSRQQIIPWGTINPADIADWAVRAGLEFTYEGHPGMPDVGLEFEDKANNVVQPNTELMEELRKQTAMGLGLSPETLDAALQPEFATSIVRNNIMMSKRAIQLQELFCPQVTDLQKKVIRNTPSLLNDLVNELWENFDEINLTPMLKKKVLGNDSLKMLVCKQTLKDLLDSLEMNLPKPDGVSLDNQLEALETIDKILDKALDQYVGTEMFTEATAGQMGQNAADIKALIKAFYMRKFMSDNGIMPDLADIASNFESAKEASELYRSQAKLFKGVIKNFGKFLIEMRDPKGRGAKLLEALDVQAGGGSSAFSSGDADTDSFFSGTGEAPETPSEPDFGLDTATPEEEPTNGEPTAPEPTEGTAGANPEENASF